MNNESPFSTPQQRTAYWRRVKRLTAWLLAIWFGTTFGVVFFARELSAYTVLGWPVSFYMAAQGMVVIYMGIIAFYVWRMRRLDKSIKAKVHHEQ